MSRECDTTVALSVEEWHALAEKGVRLPVSILIKGESMRPLIRRMRDKVTIVPIQRKPKIGEIVLFRKWNGGGIYAIHRVWKIKNGTVRTFGDGSRSPDAWITIDHILGLVIKVERGDRTIYPDAGGRYVFGRIWLLLSPFRRTWGLIMSMQRWRRRFK